MDETLQLCWSPDFSSSSIADQHVNYYLTHLLDGLAQNLVQIFMLPRRWILLSLVIPWGHHEVVISAFVWTTIGWIALKFCRHSCPFRMNKSLWWFSAEYITDFKIATFARIGWYRQLFHPCNVRIEKCTMPCVSFLNAFYVLCKA